jgi:hypothetical protein
MVIVTLLQLQALSSPPSISQMFLLKWYNYLGSILSMILQLPRLFSYFGSWKYGLFAEFRYRCGCSMLLLRIGNGESQAFRTWIRRSCSQPISWRNQQGGFGLDPQHVLLVEICKTESRILIDPPL